MIALPVLGAFFSFYLFKSDFKRWKAERAHLSTLSRPKKRFLVPLALFGGAGAADFIDGLLHFGIAYGLIANLAHHSMVVLERFSVGCAVVSTVTAVLGEILSLRMQRARKLATETSP